MKFESCRTLTRSVCKSICWPVTCIFKAFRFRRKFVFFGFISLVFLGAVYRYRQKEERPNVLKNYMEHMDVDPTMPVQLSSDEHSKDSITINKCIDAQRKRTSTERNIYDQKWPGYQELKQMVNGLLTNSTFADPKKSHMTIFDKKGPYKLGEYVRLKIILCDKNGTPLTRGGDMLRLWGTGSISPNTKTNVAGNVTDHGDGTYTGTILLPWKSKMWIHCNISQTYQARTSMMAYTDTYGSAMIIIGRFEGTDKNTKIAADNSCGPLPTLIGEPNVCNMTEQNEGVLWYCGRPKNPALSCDDWKYITIDGHHMPGQFHQMIGQQMHLRLSDRIEIDVTEGDTLFVKSNVLCSKRPRKETWFSTSPSGFYYNGTWMINGCNMPEKLSQPLSDPEMYKKCFKGRHILLIGDSNARTFADFFKNLFQLVDNIPNMNLNKNWFELYYGVLKEYDLSVSWKIHEMPFYPWVRLFDRHLLDTPTYKLLDSIPTGNNSIIVIHFWLHMCRAPLATFRTHVQQVRDSVVRLLDRVPTVDVVIKGPHSFTYKLYIQPLDYIYHEHIKIWQSEFECVMDRVLFVDMWDLTMGIENVDAHPFMLKDMADSFTMYFCKDS